MKVTVYPGSIQGEMSVPSSKSHTIRALVIATLAGGRSYIRNPLLSEDCKAAMRIARQFGSTITMQDGVWIVDGPTDGIKTPEDVVSADNSGTTLYFMTSIASLLKDYTVFTGDNSLRKRPVQPLLDALKTLGATAACTCGNGCAPFFIKGPIHGGQVEITCTTSQYISSMMIAAPLCEQDVHITTPHPMEIPYLNMTIKWLREAGIELSYDEAEYKFFHIKGGQQYKPFDKYMPADWSSVAFPIVAALTAGSSLTIHNMDFQDVQGDAAIIDYLIAMGADIQKDMLNGDLVISGGRPLHGITVDMMNTPDALPILCVAGAIAQGTMVLNNVAGARLKETDRASVMTEVLSAMGVDITATHNTITIHGGRPLQGCALPSYDDHRIAMALTVAGLFAQGKTHIAGAQCASVTFPGFYDKLRSCGAHIEEH